MKSALAALLIAIAILPPVYGKDDYHGLPPAGAATQGAALLAVCAACHGMNGIGMSPTHPNLAGQGYNYILKELENFRSGARKSSIMTGMAMTIPPSPKHANLKDIAAYFSQLTPMWTYVAVGAVPATAAQLKLGKIIYRRGNAAEGLPACAACHGLNGEGNGPMAIPALAGQHAPYMLGELQRFASGRRTNSPGQVMYTISRAMTADEENAVIAYLAQMHPDQVLGMGPKNFTAYAQLHGAPAAPKAH